MLTLRAEPGAPPAPPASPLLEPALSPAEQALLRAALSGRAAGIEYGCGGSTGLLLEAGLPLLLSTDSDARWLERVAADPRCAEALAAGRLRLRHLDVGATGAWGWPVDAGRLATWPRYAQAPWDAVGPIDFVFIDGRFRVACALQSAVRLAPGGIVAMHDFWTRSAYRPPLLRHFEVVGSAASLALLTPRRPVDGALLAADLASFGFDPR